MKIDFVVTKVGINDAQLGNPVIISVTVYVTVT